jgi:hypothetical protein
MGRKTIDINDIIRYKLKTPIAVKIVKEGSEYIASIEALNLWISTDNFESAIELIKREVFMLWNNIKDSSASMLGPYPLKCKKLLMEIIEDE